MTKQVLFELTTFLSTLVGEMRAWHRFTFSISKVDHPHVLFVVQWRGVKHDQEYGEAWDVRPRDTDVGTLSFHLLRLIESARATRTPAEPDEEKRKDPNRPTTF